MNYATRLVDSEARSTSLAELIRDKHFKTKIEAKALEFKRF